MESTNIKNKCAGCLGDIIDREFLRCCLCSQYYDLKCTNVSEKRFNNTMTLDHKQNWKCPECRNKERKFDNSNTPIRAEKSDEREFVPCSEMSNVTIRKTAKPEKSMKDINIEELNLVVRDAVGRAVKEQFKSLTDLITELQRSMSFLNDQYEDLKKSLEERCSAVKTLKEENSRLHAAVATLTENLNRMEQHQLANDIDISGVPEVKEESTMHIVLAVAVKLGVSLSETDVVSAERVGPMREGMVGQHPRPRPLAVRLARRVLRNDLLQAARARRGVTTADLGVPGEAQRFYLNERLSRTNRQLFSKAREIGKRLDWKYIWTRDGTVYARQRHDSLRLRIRSIADLIRVFGPDSVGSPTDA